MNSLIPTATMGGLYDAGDIARVVDVFVGNQTSRKTKEAYRYDLAKWTDFYRGTEWPNIEDALAFREHLEGHLSGRSAARVFNTVRSFFRFIGGLNPFERLKAPQRVKNATPEVPDDILVINMLDLCDDERDKFILTLLLNGLRREEVATMPSDALQWSPTYGCDIIKVVGKGNKERLVPANRETSMAYRAYVEDWGLTTEWMFPMSHPYNKGHISLRTVEYVCEKWSKKAGKKVSPHKLRHHYATRMVRAKADVFSLAKMLGHESVATTQVYVSLDLKDMVETASRDPLNLAVKR